MSIRDVLLGLCTISMGALWYWVGRLTWAILRLQEEEENEWVTKYNQLREEADRWREERNNDD